MEVAAPSLVLVPGPPRCPRWHFSTSYKHLLPRAQTAFSLHNHWQAPCSWLDSALFLNLTVPPITPTALCLVFFLFNKFQYLSPAYVKVRIIPHAESCGHNASSLALRAHVLLDGDRKQRHRQKTPALPAAHTLGKETYPGGWVTQGGGVHRAGPSGQ